ncbi:hypothetical protein IEO21_10138 [Rhodonia placenta]|uniref:Uncharacterized protein n=1 Tax=Rhodonia placenta TaxID=104341 RepID=A0A8H7NTE6_9APHY|nr:hypothetical protein IEO21_10138 [Postia placenta]
MLDEVTKLRYEDRLHKSIQGITRNALVHSYRTYKDTNYVPKTVYSAIKWLAADPFAMTEPFTESEWTIVQKPKSIQKGHSGY